MTRSKIILAGVIAVAITAVVLSLLIQYRTRIKSRANDTLLQQQDDQLARLTAENQRLSILVAQAKTSGAPGADRTAELEQLRAKVEALRQQTDELTKQRAESRRLAGAKYFSDADSNLLDHNHESAITFSGGPQATGKLNDARAITAALRKYADEHHGAFPLNLEQAAPWLPKALEADAPPSANAPLTGTSDFEIVFQGSQSDLADIPPRRVALICERQPWLTPEGKWARVYGYADGAASIVESDDDFQSWDLQHIIPPPGHGK